MVDTDLEIRNVTDTLESIPGWDRLTDLEKSKIHQGTRGLFNAVRGVRSMELEWGKYLDYAESTLKPKGLWIRYLRHIQLRPKTADRWMKRYHQLKTIPGHIQDFARMRGISEISPTILKVLPPPRSKDPEVIEEYLEKVQKRHRAERKTVKRPPANLQKEIVFYAGARAPLLPESWSAKDRTAWWVETAGMMFAKVGVHGSQNVQPVKPPEPGKPGRKRERK